MANASRFGFGDVVLVPFPFTDQSGTKKRPAVVVSSTGYNASRRDIVIMAITSQVRQPPGFGDALVSDWQAAGLIKPSVLKPVFTTIEQHLVIRTMGRLNAQDKAAGRRRGPVPQWQQQIEAVAQLPKAQQQFVARMIKTVLAEAQASR